GIFGDIEPHGPAALVDRLRPGDGVDHVQAVEPRLPEAALLHMASDHCLAVAVGRVAAEAAWAAEVAVARLDVVDLELPAGDILRARVARPFRLRHRRLLRTAVVSRPRRTA